MSPCQYATCIIPRLHPRIDHMSHSCDNTLAWIKTHTYTHYLWKHIVYVNPTDISIHMYSSNCFILEYYFTPLLCMESPVEIVAFREVFQILQDFQGRNLLGGSWVYENLAFR